MKRISGVKEYLRRRRGLPARGSNRYHRGATSGGQRGNKVASVFTRAIVITHARPLNGQRARAITSSLARSCSRGVSASNYPGYDGYHCTRVTTSSSNIRRAMGLLGRRARRGQCNRARGRFREKATNRFFYYASYRGSLLLLCFGRGYGY